MIDDIPNRMKNVKFIEDVDTYWKEHIEPYFGDFSTERGRKITGLLLEHGAVMGAMKTLFDALDDPALIKKIAHGSQMITHMDVLKSMTAPTVKRFLDYCDEHQFNYDLWIHPASDEKIDIGYDSDEVGITLAYAKDDIMTHFFVYIRPDGEYVRIPRRTIKRFVGTKDMKTASEQAIRNLEGIMLPGKIGPFPENPADQIHIDQESYEQTKDKKINLPTGLDNVSFNIRFKDAVDALKGIYTNVDTISVFDTK